MKHKTTLSTLVLATTAATVYWVYAQASYSPNYQAINSVKLSQQKSTISWQELVQQESLRMPNQRTNDKALSSLYGSQPDGAVNLDANGQVIADDDLHRLFDYYLSAQGETSLQQIKHRLLTVSGDFLSLDQLEQVRDLFDAYVNYLSEADRLSSTLSPDLSLQDRLDAIHSHRIEVLGAELTDAFFADEHAYAMWVIQLDSGELNQLTKQQQHWLNQENNATAYQDVWLENQALSQAGVSQQDRLILRSSNYGQEVALRLAELDQQQQQWQQTVSHYISQRTALQGDHNQIAQLDQQYDDRTLLRLHVHYQDHLRKI
ncbi:lipase secretion chaperone [Marinicella sp. S1101]|uniref:lipase secretion chaperone n=1 Tax=Marinicella marina TaxID=2996016 RepID=UPI002260D722|nr:lipase secretion chaperone [Marinicella marina]MCX7554131.1 lipase secretion chaperone [Marinicella marina]MDJ1141176.1 lipase secretion chaperone [Marinicella marina]